MNNCHLPYTRFVLTEILHFESVTMFLAVPSVNFTHVKNFRYLGITITICFYFTWSVFLDDTDTRKWVIAVFLSHEMSIAC